MSLLRELDPFTGTVIGESRTSVNRYERDHPGSHSRLAYFEAHASRRTPAPPASAGFYATFSVRFAWSVATRSP